MKRRYKIVLWTVVGVWAIALLLSLVPMLVRAHHEANVVRGEFSEYGTSLVNRHFDQAYQYCGTDFRRAMPYDRFVKLYQDLEQQYGNLNGVTRRAFDVEGRGNPMYWRAVIDADFVYQKKTLRFEFVFHKEGDRWAILGSKQL